MGAFDANHPPEHNLFVKLAARESIPLATFDNGILTKFPEIANRPAISLVDGPPTVGGDGQQAPSRSQVRHLPKT